jgi:hypothetical protein
MKPMIIVTGFMGQSFNFILFPHFSKRQEEAQSLNLVRKMVYLQKEKIFKSESLVILSNISGILQLMLDKYS